MKFKEILKRSYYALIVAGLMLVPILFIDLSIWNYRDISFIALLSLGICWILTRHNKPSAFKWYAGIIITLTLLYVYLPMFGVYFPYDSKYEIKFALAVGYVVCAMVSTFLSNTKYYNILPNQSKGVSTLFRVLSWLVQTAIIAIVLSICVERIIVTVDKDFYKKRRDKRIERYQEQRRLQEEQSNDADSLQIDNL